MGRKKYRAYIDYRHTVHQNRCPFVQASIWWENQIWHLRVYLVGILISVRDGSIWIEARTLKWSHFLVALTDDLSLSIDRKQPSIFILLDLSSTSYTLDLKILLFHFRVLTVGQGNVINGQVPLEGMPVIARCRKLCFCCWKTAALIKSPKDQFSLFCYSKFPCQLDDGRTLGTPR